LLAIVLTAAGLYAVLAQRVARRRRELAVRIALGAERGDLMRLVIAHAARLVVPAMVIGLAVATVLSRWLGSQLFGISAGDPLTSAGVATGLLIVTALAGYVPARRASSADPMIALRAE
jgi:ABC-type antimicrobial peptide transport system permease subunit